MRAASRSLNLNFLSGDNELAVLIKPLTFNYEVARANLQAFNTARRFRAGSLVIHDTSLLGLNLGFRWTCV